MRIAAGADGRDRVALVDLDDPAASAEVIEVADLPARAAALEQHGPRWVWSDTRHWYPMLLDAGVRIERCHDLLLCGAILEGSTDARAAREAETGRPRWLDAAPNLSGGGVGAVAPSSHSGAGATALFELGEALDDGASPNTNPATVVLDAVVAEFRRQERLTRASARPGAMRLLLAAESAGALIGAELHAAGLPWRREVHEAILEAELGPRPKPGWKPERMAILAAEVRAALEQPSANLDSQVELLRALRNAGIQVDSTAKWELRDHDHPAIAPLLAYKRSARLLSANGWAWLDEWIADGRFRPDYVPGGTATGRWATSGGGALQLPKNIRGAVVADPGWSLVVADAAQLEPRVLAGLAHDDSMAAAARGRDIYQGIVDDGVVETRDQAKVAILGAMYGATTGDSGRLVPRLARAYPRAMALVDRAAATGERGGQVTTNLGRSSPAPASSWHAVQARASEPDATPADERRARSVARDWGRFTRNFVVQGSAAEWALCWMAALRTRLAALPPSIKRAERSGPVFGAVPHLVYYLHDEIIVHTPSEHAEAVATAVRACAVDAGRLLFGDFPVDFPLDLAIVDSYAMADG
ncbi:bifunctional 3'-5' exonuclease/DNA polymerase [Agromyces sp. H3Y2-19a]|uniref:bifunctional 3'-5' exonuclease/DNA polymerase n=1 Tax=Agromyces chromiiresistens TaxID=3030835 RepID=UPI0023B99B03|nr:bifunctional 3'-5' exonuclease/DNA polymerase [Agromyces chromiiresistens]MDF0513301.1 bifunctional 3'-5' exonuclease/DNA polymerase [Agromyces chromiiresistens]